MDEVLVSKTSTESVYYKLKTNDDGLDGRVERDGESFDVPFWSYVSTAQVSPITTTKFHKELWSGNTSDEEWTKKFWSRETPFTMEELGSIKQPAKYTGNMQRKPRPEFRVRMAEPKDSTPEEPNVKVGKPSSRQIDSMAQALGDRLPNPSNALPDVLPQERVTGDVLRGHGPRRGNLERLLRWWRPRMRMEGGFRRCLVTLADHPELYPLENICAWLHHETTGLWPNEGCHHPGMKNCRRQAARLIRGEKPVRGSILSDSEFAQQLAKLRPKKKSLNVTPNSIQNHVDFKALAYWTTTGTRMSVKGGLVSSNSRTTRALESIASYAIPGDMSRLRKPGRSTAYRAMTPGGGRSRIGGPAIFRCPDGFANGGRYTNRRFTTCGPRLFEKPGSSDSVLDATRRAVGATNEIAQGMIADTLAAKKPKRGVDLIPGDYSIPVAIQRAAEVAEITAPSPKKVTESIMVNASLVFEDRKTPGKLVRRDGSVMDLSVPISRLVDVKNSDDMKDGFLISRVEDPLKMGDAEVPTLGTDLKGFVLALPDNNHVRVTKTPKATTASMRGAVRRFNAIKDSEDPMDYGSALQKMVDESRGALSLDYHMPGIKNPEQIIQIQRDGAMRSVVRWVYQLFLAEGAPARNKATKPWSVVVAQH